MHLLGVGTYLFTCHLSPQRNEEQSLYLRKGLYPGIRRHHRHGQAAGSTYQTAAAVNGANAAD